MERKTVYFTTCIAHRNPTKLTEYKLKRGDVRPCRLVNSYRDFEKLSVDYFDPAYEGSTIMRLAGNYIRVDTV